MSILSPTVQVKLSAQLSVLKSLVLSVYARLEDLQMDSLYFFKKANLLERVTLDMVLNSAHNEDRTEERSILDKLFYFDGCFARFWRQVDRRLLPKLNLSWTYKNDFEMFDYSFDQYLQNFNIEL